MSKSCAILRYSNIQEISALELAMLTRDLIEHIRIILYLTKIKKRFLKQTDIYVRFLEILRTFCRQSKPIHAKYTQDVYAGIRQLFSTESDLIEELGKFLPESAAQVLEAAAKAEDHGWVPETDNPESTFETRERASPSLPQGGAVLPPPHLNSPTVNEKYMVRSTAILFVSLHR